MKVEKLELVIEIPENIQVSVKDSILTTKGQKGEVVKNFVNPQISILVEKNLIKLMAKNATKREKKLMNTFRAHIKNMFKGVTEGHIYQLKICSGHFPMNVSVQGNEFIVKNFLGERFPRKLTLKENVGVKVEGDIVTVESSSKELAGQTAADIEQLTKIKGRDLRIFQDGIWIINKDGKQIK